MFLLFLRRRVRADKSKRLTSSTDSTAVFGLFGSGCHHFSVDLIVLIMSDDMTLLRALSWVRGSRLCLCAKSMREEE